MLNTPLPPAYTASVFELLPWPPPARSKFPVKESSSELFRYFLKSPPLQGAYYHKTCKAAKLILQNKIRAFSKKMFILSVHNYST